MENDYFSLLDRDISTLFSKTSIYFSCQENDEIGTYIQPGEYGLALESICFLIEEKNILIDSATKNLALALAERMELDTELDP